MRHSLQCTALRFSEEIPSTLAEADHWCRLAKDFLASLPTAMSVYSEDDQGRFLETIQAFPGCVITGACKLAAALGAVTVVDSLRPFVDQVLEGKFLALMDAKVSIDRIHQWVIDETKSSKPTGKKAKDGSAPGTLSGKASRPRSKSDSRVGRPRLEKRTDPKSQSKLNLYRIIIRRKQEAASAGRLAELLNRDRDLRSLAKDAGFANGVTEAVVRCALQFERDRQKNPQAEKPPN